MEIYLVLNLVFSSNALLMFFLRLQENERQLREWEWKLYLLKIMQTGFTNAGWNTITINNILLLNKEL